MKKCYAKRILSLFMTVAMLLTMVPASVFATGTDASDDGVTVRYSVSYDENYVVGSETGEVMALKEITVPYFDLAEYGLEEYYFSSEEYGDDGDGAPGSDLEPGTPEYAEGKPTVLHLYIYALEVFEYGLDADEAGQGYLLEQDLMDTDAFTITGGAGSTFLNAYWGTSGGNTMYFRNYEYPLASEGWGATSDQMLLREGDIITLGHVNMESGAFYNPNGGIFNYISVGGDATEGDIGTTTVTQGEEVTLSLYHAFDDVMAPVGTTHTPVDSEPEVFYISSDDLGNNGVISDWTSLGYADASGEIVLDTTELEPGNYLVAMPGEYDDTWSAGSVPGAIWLTVEAGEEPEPQTVTVTYDANGGELTGDDTASIVVGEKLTAPADPTREGFTFKGWMTEKDNAETAWNFDENAVSAAMTLYALWEENAPEIVGPAAGEPFTQDTVDVRWYNTEDTVFEIDTAAEFAGFMAIVNGTAVNDADGNPIEEDRFSGKTVKLTADIDLQGSALYGSLTESRWYGTLDGQGHTLDGVKISASTREGNGYASLFYMLLGGKIINLTMGEDCEFVGQRASAFASNVNGGIIANCVNKATVKGYQAAGIAHSNESGGVVVNCANYGKIYNDSIKEGYEWCLGGIVAYNYGKVLNSHNQGELDAGTYDKGVIGGIVGAQWGGSIRNCYSAGKITTGAEATGDSYSPYGIAGNSGSGVENSYFIASADLNTADILPYPNAAADHGLGRESLTAAELNSNVFVDVENGDYSPILIFENGGNFPAIESTDTLEVEGAELGYFGVTLDLGQAYEYLSVSGLAYEITVEVEGEEAFTPTIDNNKRKMVDEDTIYLGFYYKQTSELSKEDKDAHVTVKLNGNTLFDDDVVLKGKPGYVYDDFYIDGDIKLKGDTVVGFFYSGDKLYMLRRSTDYTMQNLSGSALQEVHRIYNFNGTTYLYELDMNTLMVNEVKSWPITYIMTEKYSEAVDDTVETYSDVIASDGFFLPTSFAGTWEDDVVYFRATKADGSTKAVFAYDVSEDTVTEVTDLPGNVTLSSTNGVALALDSANNQVYRLTDSGWSEAIALPDMTVDKQTAYEEDYKIEAVWADGETDLAVLAYRKLQYQDMVVTVWTSTNNGADWQAHDLKSHLGVGFPEGKITGMQQGSQMLFGKSLDELAVSGFLAKPANKYEPNYVVMVRDGNGWKAYDTGTYYWNQGTQLFGQGTDSMIFARMGFLDEGGAQALQYNVGKVLTGTDDEIVLIEGQYGNFTGLKVHTANIEIPDIDAPEYMVTGVTDPEGAATITARFLETKGGKDYWRLNLSNIQQGWKFSHWDDDEEATAEQVVVSIDSSNATDVVYTAHFEGMNIVLGEEALLLPVSSAGGPNLQLTNKIVPTDGQPLGVQVTYTPDGNIGSANVTLTMSYKDGEKLNEKTLTWMQQAGYVAAVIDLEQLAAADNKIVVTLTGSKTTTAGEITFNETKEYTVNVGEIDETVDGTAQNIVKWTPVGGTPEQNAITEKGASVQSAVVVTDEATGVSTLYTAGHGGVMKKTTLETAFTAMDGDFNTDGSWGWYNSGAMAIGGSADELLLFTDEQNAGNGYDGDYGIFLYRLNDEGYWEIIEDGWLVKNYGNTWAESVILPAGTNSYSAKNIDQAVVLSSGEVLALSSGTGLIFRWDGVCWEVMDFAEGVTPNTLEQIGGDVAIAGSDKGLWKYSGGEWSQVTWSTNSGINESLNPNGKLYVLSTAANGNIYATNKIAGSRDLNSRRYMTSGDVYRIQTSRTTDMNCVTKMPVDADHNIGSYTMGEDINGNIYAVTPGIGYSTSGDWGYGTTGHFWYLVDAEESTWTLINLGGDLYDFPADGSMALHANRIGAFLNPTTDLTLFTGYFGALYAVDEMPVGSVDLDEVKETAKAELEDYLEDHRADNYSEEKYADVTAAYESGLDAIDAAADIDGVRAALKAAKDAIDAVEPDLQSVKTVYASISEDGTYEVGADGTVLAYTPVTVEWFDLAEYGLERFNTYGRDGKVLKQPTMLHLFIKMTEQYYLGYDPDSSEKLEVGVTKRDPADSMYALEITGGAGSMYMQNFWGRGENLNYYLNHQYPLMESGLGSTADYITLNNGDFVELAMYSDWNFWQDPNAGFRYVASEDGKTVDQITMDKGTLSVRRATSNMNGERGDAVIPNAKVYWCEASDVTENVADWNPLATSDSEGKFNFDFSDKEPGDYYIGVGGTSVGSPGMIVVHIEDNGGDTPVDPSDPSDPSDPIDPVVLHTITVIGGSADKTTAKADETVTITADGKSGYRFDKWIVKSGNVQLDNKTSSTTSFVMPDEDVVIEANYEKKSSGSTSGGSKTDSEVKATENLIDEIGKVTLADKERIEAARKAYDKLTRAQQKKVKNYNDLVKAEKALQELLAEQKKLPFADVATDDPACEAIAYVYENGLMAGVNDGTTFDPSGDLSRGMLASVLYRYAGSPAVDLSNGFTDVPTGLWYTDAVLWANINGVVSGYGDGKSFGPNDSITREQVASILFRYAKSVGADVTTDKDCLAQYADAAEVSFWAAEAMNWAVGNGVINPVDGKLLGGGAASRAQIAQALMALIENVLPR